MGRLENRLSVILSRIFTWIRSLDYDARNMEGCSGYCEKNQVLRHESVPLKHYFSMHTEKQLEGTLVCGMFEHPVKHSTLLTVCSAGFNESSWTTCCRF